MSVYQKMADRLIRKGYIEADDREVYAYGFDIIFYTIWSTAVLLVIGILFRKFWDAVVMVAVFYAFQCTGGGYHANTHWKCLLTMVVGLILGLIMCCLGITPVVLWIIMGIGTILLLALPLVLHPRKAYLENRRKSLSIRSVIVTFCILAIAITVSMLLPWLLCAFAMSFLFAAISRVTGKTIYGKTGRKDPPNNSL